MQEPHGEGPASHADPESCAGLGNTAGEALTGAHVGRISSCEIRSFGEPTVLSDTEGNIACGVTREPRAVPAQSKTPCMRGNSSHGNRESPSSSGSSDLDRPVKVSDQQTGRAHV